MTQEWKNNGALAENTVHAKIEDAFWSNYRSLVRDVVLPYQWEALNDRIPGAEKSYAVQNFKIAAGLEQGQFGGMVFQDSDIAKWLEAIGYVLQEQRDPELEAIADEMISILEKAQLEDGYLNTYYTLKEPGKRWTNLAECHELYVAGHFMEAAVAYYEATGKTPLLDLVCRMTDNIADVFGDGPGQLPGYDGHPEVELALIKLYRATGNQKYLDLSNYFLNKRGQQPNFFEEEAEKRGWTGHWHPGPMKLEPEYWQSHKPVVEMDTAVGHAVRMVYLCAGMADVARINGDEAMKAACERLWTNIASRQMYVTGGIGSMAQGEAFSVDYDLPNDTAYSETCASIGLIFFAWRMLQMSPQRKYADVMERALYNTVLAGMAKDGRHFFYVNPLEVEPHVCEGKNLGFNHVKPVRQEWFGCACCPPNIARLIASLGDYLYTVQNDTVFAHLYIGGKATVQVKGQDVMLDQQAELPWSGNVRFQVQTALPVSFALALRVPEWSRGARLLVNGQESILVTPEADGYFHLEREWKDGDTIELALEMPVLRLYSHPKVRADAGKVALQRGPLVYCLEEADNGPLLSQVWLSRSESSAPIQPEWDEELLDGMIVLHAEAWRMERPDSDRDTLYHADRPPVTKPFHAVFIPYYAWANRGKGEMTVWVKEQPQLG
ncbi:beta-L-arabinofuranosidase domain-containing protein [Gorillibacterium sp. CAU 1737]|uniref:glycoside hydrolase family 127 protein n=1 Tax=Gorillibacterium sp. CAU 1737 TaxID=3140362 RepID=UPI0032607882